MKTWITITGIECATCSNEIGAELLVTHTVEDIFNGLHKKILFIHLKKGIAKGVFLNAMNRIPVMLNKVITKYGCTCKCCADVKIDLSLD
ncbi:hypothetical protein SAMN04488700_0849 [Carnobacterium iners]|uniref:Uncharacterized protein n=1 Tax=Carnobacterium iners TaxID=1073423 RepID=A0A1X7MVH7_9LACT|nr:hypothetical protein [Carnobacterium iners]SEK57206.1 hypothetical protein SAMN04488114_10658 [Carnobacterium iners]SMH28127.1 hypothetical protein SAMN04488700_0849 [Carnobacterium iners]